MPPKEYLVTVAIQADSLDAAKRTAEGWDLGDAEVRIISGPPETWAPEPPVPVPDNGAER
ncbi:MAG: hypothetical protein J2P57_07780 [Acidimicrobiaceae bacterium]|nr:hypothetical protein [Acidimicrobiaceae bacterium]